MSVGTAVAPRFSEIDRNTDMATQIRTLSRAAAAFAALGLGATGAQAGDFSNASTYNAPYNMAAGQENQVPNASLRDANGNLTAVNGQITSSNFGAASGAGASGSGVASAHAGVGTGGAGTAYGSATAIGNQLNVVTLGNNNTVVVNATQTNNGTVTATTTVNGQ